MVKFVKIKVYRLADGTTRNVLVYDEGHAGTPLFHSNLYLSFPAIRHKPFNTQKQILRAIMSAFAWGVRDGVDFESCLLSRDYLNEASIVSLCDAMLLKYRPLKEQAASLSAAREKGQTLKLIPFPDKGNNVSAGTANARIDYVAGYFEWLGKRAIKSLDYRKRQGFEEQFEDMLEVFENCKRSGTLSVPTMPLSDEAEQFLTQAIEPGSVYNVWAPEAQLRNYLILQIYLQTAMRRAEVLALRVKDFERENNILNLVKRDNDPEDPRIEKPGVKTVSRTLPLTPKVSALLQQYISSVRTQHKAARKHPFLLTSLQDGQPLSLAAVSKLVGALTVHPLLEDLTPHVLRHTWNDRFLRDCAEDGVDSTLAAAYQRRFCGWSSTSAMPATYTEAEAMRRFRELAVKRQEGYSK